MLALCSMLLGTYYAQNYASIIGGSLPSTCHHFLAAAPLIATISFKITAIGTLEASQARCNRV